MIGFTKMKDIDREDVLRFLKEHEVYELGMERFFPSMFLIKERNNIYGFGIMEYIEEETSVIHKVYVIPQKREQQYEEGLVRTMLNYAYMKGIKSTFYIENNSTMYSLLQLIGFQENLSTKLQDNRLHEKEKVNKVLYVELAEFFGRSCKSDL